MFVALNQECGRDKEAKKQAPNESQAKSGNDCITKLLLAQLA